MSDNSYSSTVTTFLADASQWITASCSIDIRFAARRTSSESGWEILAAHIGIVPFPLVNSENFEFSLEVGDFWFGQEQLHDVPASIAQEIIKDACEGSVALYSKVITMRGSEKGYSRANLGDEWFVSYLGLLVSTYPQSDDLPKVTPALENELRRSSPPFDGLSDLLTWLNLANDFDDQGQTRLRINIAAPADVVVDQTRVTNGQLHVTVVAHPTLDPKSLHVAVRGAPPRGITSRVQIADKIIWGAPLEGKRFGSAIVELPGVDSGQIMLAVGNQYIRRHWFVDPVRSQNERYFAMRLFDSNLKIVRRYLLDEHNSDKFELAVAALIFMMGFNPAVQCETDAADIVVMAPSGRLALVECTLKLSDVPSKVGKLVHRREALAKALSTDGRIVEVLSVLVCQADHPQVAADEIDLAHKGVLLVTKGLLTQQIDSRLHYPTNPEKVYMDALERLAQLTAVTTIRPIG